MIKRRPKVHYVFYAAIVLIVLVGIGSAIWLHGRIYPKISTSLQSFECTEQEKEQLCYLTYTLKNETDHQITTNLNGINGPGFAETHASKVFVVLSNGTKIPIFAGSNMGYDSHIESHETVKLTDKVTIPIGQKVESIKIFDDTYRIDA